MTVCCNVVEVTRPQEPFVAINQLPPSIVQLSAPGPQGPPGTSAIIGALVETDQTIAANIVLSSGKNAVSVGDVAIAAGYSVTVPSGARWVVV